MPLIVKVKKLQHDSILPSYVHKDDAGMDIFSHESLTIRPGERKKIATGIAMELPKGYVALVWDKSGLAANFGITNLAGVIDAGYRGEYFVTLYNTSKKIYKIEKAHKIAQILIQKVESPIIKEVKKLSNSLRGDKGHGSTGK